METTKFKVTTYIMEMFRAVRLKKFFLFFTLTPSLFAVTGWQTVIKGVRVSVRVVFLPSHLPSRPLFFRQECILLVTGIQWASRKQRYTGRIAMLHYRCKYAAHLVPDGCTFLAPFFCEFYLCWTIGIPMLYYQYTYAVLSVYLCWTFGTRMLYSSGTVFSICLQAISRRIKSSFFVLL